MTLFERSHLGEFTRPQNCMPYTNTQIVTNTELNSWHTRNLKMSNQSALTFSEIESLCRSLAIFFTWTDNGAAAPAPAAASCGSRNNCSHSCGKGWQFMRALHYARNPTPPSGKQTMAGEIMFMLYLRSTALLKLGMQHWLFSVNQYPGGPGKPHAHGFNLEHHRHQISETLASRQSQYVSASPEWTLSECFKFLTCRAKSFTDTPLFPPPSPFTGLQG